MSVFFSSFNMFSYSLATWSINVTILQVCGDAKAEAVWRRHLGARPHIQRSHGGVLLIILIRIITIIINYHNQHHYQRCPLVKLHSHSLESVLQLVHRWTLWGCWSWWCSCHWSSVTLIVMMMMMKGGVAIRWYHCLWFSTPHAWNWKTGLRWLFNKSV